MNPKHNTQTKPRKDRDADVRARAPYNFVALPDDILRVCPDDLPDHSTESGHTGWMDCTLSTRSPLYVRGLQTRHDFAAHAKKSFGELDADAQKNRVDFFSLEGSPIIPGSSLRGMLRGLFEIITFSKVDRVSKEPLVYRAVADAADSPLGANYRQQLSTENVLTGYMRKNNGDWFVQPAKPAHVNCLFARTNGVASKRDAWHMCKNAWKIAASSFKRDKYGRDWLDDVATGDTHVLLKSGWTVGKDRTENHYVFGLPDDTANLIEISTETVERYKEQVSQQQVTLLGSKEGVLVENQPVFYVLNSDPVHKSVNFFGHTRYFRLPYAQTPHDLVPEHLRNEHDVDMAEALFGYVKSNTQQYGKDRAYASRVRVGDATLAPNAPTDWSLPQLSPKILSSPKLTTFQHYLVQDAHKKHEPDHQPDLAHFDTPKTETAIRGHKLYWHKNSADEKSIRAVGGESKNQLTGIKPVRAGIGFAFKIHFYNLSAVELGALLWALDLPASCCHSLGMGKPLGMGAVRLAATLHLQDRTARAKQLFAPDGQWFDPTPDHAPTLVALKTAFETHAQQTLKLAGTFAQTARIRDLLRILEWDSAPLPDWTRYMEIEHRDSGGSKVNEYKLRPALPNPADVIGGLDPNRDSQPAQPKPKIAIAQSPLKSPSAEELAVVQERERKKNENSLVIRQGAEAKMAAPKAYGIGQEIEVEVKSINRKTYVCVVASDQKTNAELDISEIKGKRVGDVIKVKIKSESAQKKLSVTTRGVSQT